VKAAKITEKIALTDAENYSRSVSGNLQSLIDEYKKYASSADYYEMQAIPEADLIIDQASKSYKAGALDYLDYVLALDRALAIRKEYLDALNSLNQTVVSIDYITGKVF
jgi:cobalt-zinc-cadmium resistance protein CzcA